MMLFQFEGHILVHNLHFTGEKNETHRAENFTQIICNMDSDETLVSISLGFDL